VPGPEGCPCVKLAATGNDADAAQSGGATPFLTFQAAVDFAGDHPEVASSVCVAADAACGGHGVFYGAMMEMRDGVSVYGNYESTGWTRCSDSTTELGPYAPEGVRFGPEIVHATLLDGLRIAVGGVSGGGFVSAVTADGATGAVLANVTLAGGGGAHIAGLRVVSGAALEASAVSVTVNTGTVDTVGIRVVDSSLRFDDGSVLANGNASVVGIELDGAAGSRVSSSSVTITSGLGDPAVTHSVGKAVYVHGDATGVELEDTTVRVTGPYYDLAGIVADSCSGAWLVSGNDVAVSNPSSGYVSGQPATAGVHVDGLCQPLLTNNSVVSTGGNGVSNVGVSCSAPCSLSDNAIGVDKSGQTPSGSQGAAIGVACDGCAAITQNGIIGLVSPSGLHTSTSYASTGLVVVGPTLVARNSIAGGCSATALGVQATNARLENNLVDGRSPDGSCGLTPPYASTSTGVVALGDCDVHSNRIRGGFAPTGIGLDVNGSNVTVRNNAISGPSAAVDQAPTLFQNNAFGGTVAGLSTEAAVNALPGASDNFAGACSSTSNSPCIDAGTTVGAPSDDYDGNARDAEPDTGPFEYAAERDACLGITCSGHGTCAEVGGAASCVCDPAYIQVPGDPHACELDPCLNNGGCDAHVSCSPLPGGGRECGDCPAGYTGDGESGCVDVNECDASNGGCDPLVACTNYPGTYSCGPCPPGYQGNGYSGCIYAEFCNPNPCTHDATCFSDTNDYICNCPAGTMGQDCSLTFSDLSGGWWYFCGLRNDGTLRCWGRDTGTTLVPPSGVFTSLSSGYDFACAIRSDQALVCFGSNDGNKATPPAGTFLAVGAGFNHACAVKSDQTLVCWGSDADGESDPPPGSFLAVDSGQAYSCGIRADGTLACWGLPQAGRTFPPAGTYQALSLGSNSACALATDQTIACWGASDEGQTTVPGGTFTDFEVGGAFVLARRTDGTIIHWGRSSGGLGQQVGTFTAVAAAGDAECGVRTFGNVTCKGKNDYGQGTAPGGPP
jgi:hypothetical protein